MSVSHDARIVLYPAYMDSEKSWKQGRRIPKSLAVEKPDAREMMDAVVRGLELEAELEMHKKYSRDSLQDGRIRVKLRSANGELVNKQIPDKNTLLRECADFCSRHPQRPQRLVELAKYHAQMMGSLNPPLTAATAPKGSLGAPGAASSSGAAAPAASSKKGSSKKKGKRK